MSQILRSFNAVIDDVDTDKREVVAKVSVGDIDRHRTVIESRGIGLDSFRQNPVVLFEHGKDPTRGALPVGRCLWIRPDTVGNGRILAKTRFATDPFSQALLEFYRDGTMRGWSIMILPKEASPPSREEIRARPELANCELVYRESDLGEYSAVSVPSCASALSMPELRTLSKLVVGGFWTPSEDVKPLVDPIVERMNESTLADGGALVDDDDDEADEPGDDEDDKPKKKKKKKRSADDAEGDAVEMRSVDVGDDDLDVVAHAASEWIDDKVVEAESVERTTPEPETAVVEVESVEKTILDAVEAVIDEFIDAAKEVEPEPTPEPAVETKPDLPPLVGRSFDDVFQEYAAMVAAWQKSSVEAIRDYADWRRGKV